MPKVAPRARRRFRNAATGLLLSLASHGLRFLANAVLLVLLARFWSPDLFGAFAFANAVAAVLGLVCGWGFAQKTMRDAAADPVWAGGAVRGAMVAQGMLAPAVLAAAVLIGLTGYGPDVGLLLPLVGAFVALNLAETAASACRGLGRFDAEAGSSILGNGAFFAAGIAAALLFDDPQAVAFALLAGRIVHVGAAFAILRGIGIDPVGASANGRSALRASAVFAGEAVATGTFLQIDTIVVKLVLGDAAAGAYQAGIRFVVVALVAAQALAGYCVPALVARIGEPKAFARVAGGVFAAFAGLGILLFLTLALFGERIVFAVYGADYARTAALAPMFGMLILLRCLAAGAGIVLLAAGEQAWRFGATLLAIAVFLGASLAAGSDYGLPGLVAADAAALLVLLCLYLARAWRLRG